MVEYFNEIWIAWFMIKNGCDVFNKLRTETTGFVLKVFFDFIDSFLSEFIGQAYLDVEKAKWWSKLKPTYSYLGENKPQINLHETNTQSSCEQHT